MQAENLGTPLAFTAPTPVSGVPVTVAESDFDDLGVEESADAMRMPTSTRAPAPGPLLSTQVELPGFVPAAMPAPELGIATASIGTEVVDALPPSMDSDAIDAAPAPAEAEVAAAVAEVNAAPTAIEAAPSSPVTYAANAPTAVEAAAPVESAPTTADLFSGRPVEPPMAYAAPTTTPVDYAATVATPFDAATRASGLDDATTDAAVEPALAATPADVAALAVTDEAEVAAPMAHDDAAAASPDARSA